MATFHPTTGQTKRRVERKSLYTQAATTSRNPVLTTQPKTETWARYRPHSEMWFHQVYRRYPQLEEHIARAENRSTEDVYFCFSCFNSIDLGDYSINGGPTQTFRYCVDCATTQQSRGANPRLIKRYANNDTQETIQLPITRAATQEEKLQANAQIPVDYQRERYSKHHALFYIGSTTFFIASLVFVWFVAVPWCQDRYNNLVYQYPHVAQVDAVVGHNDSPKHPTHFIAENLEGTIEVIEQQGGDPSKTKVYVIAHLSPDTSRQVITLSFDGSTPPNMIVKIGTLYVTELKNDGATFKP